MTHLLFLVTLLCPPLKWSRFFTKCSEDVGAESLRCLSYSLYSNVHHLLGACFFLYFSQSQTVALRVGFYVALVSHISIRLHFSPIDSFWAPGLSLSSRNPTLTDTELSGERSAGDVGHPGSMESPGEPHLGPRTCPSLGHWCFYSCPSPHPAPALTALGLSLTLVELILAIASLATQDMEPHLQAGPRSSPKGAGWGTRLTPNFTSVLPKLPQHMVHTSSVFN